MLRTLGSEGKRWWGSQMACRSLPLALLNCTGASRYAASSSSSGPSAAGSSSSAAVSSSAAGSTPSSALSSAAAASRPAAGAGQAGSSTPAGAATTRKSSAEPSLKKKRKRRAFRFRGQKTNRALRKRRRHRSPTAATSSASPAATSPATSSPRSAGKGALGKASVKGVTSTQASKKAATSMAIPAASSPSAISARRRRRRGTTPAKSKKLRVCVLSSSYEGAESETAALDNYVCTPAHYIKRENRRKYHFVDVPIHKKDAYRTVRELVTSQKYDVFFNLCDGGRDEMRAGAEVVSALEDLNAAFTGTDSRCFEPSKVEMKLLVRSSGVRVPNYVLLKNAEGLAKRCCHLQFPVIVKHVTGYASVGIQKDNLCHNIDELRVKVKAFAQRYNHALVEEFIVGREGTVLATADPASPHGVKVFRPLMFSFLQGPMDFAYFEKKWKVVMDEHSQQFLPISDPAYPAILEMARNAFHYVLQGVGYGRVDFRIDEATKEPVFLEINPNCGMWYNEKDGGDYADIMVQGDSHWTHERFFINAARQALKVQNAHRPWYIVSQDKNGHFTSRATRTVPEGYCLFGDSADPVPVLAKALFKLPADGEEPDPTRTVVSCAIVRGDGRPRSSVTIRHSCEPNMHFIHGRTLMFATKRPINAGEELSVDYGTLRDESMPRFTCTCGTKHCRKIVFATPPTARTIEVKAMKKLLREKKQQWIQEKADREAEQIIKKRTKLNCSTSSSSGSSSSSGGASSGGSASAA